MDALYERGVGDIEILRYLSTLHTVALQHGTHAAVKKQQPPAKDLFYIAHTIISIY